MMIESLLLIDDEDLFHLVFEDACNILDISLTLQTMSSVDEAERMFKYWFESGDKKRKPECVFVDLNMVGSTFDGIGLVDRINNRYGNGVIIGIISSSYDPIEIQKARTSGAQFWIVKSDEIEPRLEEFKIDYPGFKNNTMPFKVYK